MEKWKEIFAKYRWRIIFTALGVLVAVLWMVLGFFRMLLILIFAMAGFALGFRLDEAEGFKTFVEKVIPERFRRSDEQD